MNASGLRETTCGTGMTVREGQSVAALPGSSDIDLFRYCESIVDVDAEISHGALFAR